MPNPQRQIHHEFFAGNRLGSTGEPPQMMAGVAVIAFNCDRVDLTDNVTFRGQYLRERIPPICIKNTIFQMLDLVI